MYYSKTIVHFQYLFFGQLTFDFTKIYDLKSVTKFIHWELKFVEKNECSVN